MTSLKIDLELGQRPTMTNGTSKSMPDDLIYAIASGQPISLAEIINCGVDINAPGTKNPRNALTAAAFAGNTNLIRTLAKNGADLSWNGSGLTAIHEAAGQGHAKAVEALLELGVSIETKTPQGVTPLMIAAAWGNCEIVRMLLTRGSDIHQRTNRGDTALMIAEEKDEEKVVEILRNVRGKSPHNFGQKQK